MIKRHSRFLVAAGIVSSFLKLSNSVLSLNSAQDRYVAESGFKNIKSYFYSGVVAFIYIDYTKNDKPALT